MNVLESWEGVRTWIMPERNRVEFWVWLESDCYKLEIRFEDILETVGYCLAGGNLYAILLKVNFLFSLNYFFQCLCLRIEVGLSFFFFLFLGIS